MSEVYQCKYSFTVYYEINKVSIIIEQSFIKILLLESQIISQITISKYCNHDSFKF